MRRHRPSEPVRPGEGKSHRLAVDIVKFYLLAKGEGLTILDPYSVTFPPRFILRHFKKGDKRTFFGHNYDLGVFDDFEKTHPYLIVEVDGESHSSKSKKINDKIAEAYIEEHLFKTELVRLQKTEVLGFAGLNNFYYLHNELGWI